jgi:hypothetical protein
VRMCSSQAMRGAAPQSVGDRAGIHQSHDSIRQEVGQTLVNGLHQTGTIAQNCPNPGTIAEMVTKMSDCE